MRFALKENNIFIGLEGGSNLEQKYMSLSTEKKIIQSLLSLLVCSAFDSVSKNKVLRAASYLATGEAMPFSVFTSKETSDFLI